MCLNQCCCDEADQSQLKLYSHTTTQCATERVGIAAVREKVTNVCGSGLFKGKNKTMLSRLVRLTKILKEKKRKENITWDG